MGQQQDKYRNTVWNDFSCSSVQENYMDKLAKEYMELLSDENKNEW